VWNIGIGTKPDGMVVEKKINAISQAKGSEGVICF